MKSQDISASAAVFFITFFLIISSILGNLLLLIVLYCASLGGWIGSEIGKTMERYDPEENKWEVIGSMAVPRYYFGCCELQGVSLPISY